MDRLTLIIASEVLMSLFGALIIHMLLERVCDNELCEITKKQKDKLKK